MDKIFAQCPACGQQWRSREAFLRDSGVTLMGYQANFDRLEAGLFLFEHGCRGSLSVSVEQFSDLHDGPVFEVRRTGTDECPGYCLHGEVLDACPHVCECAYVREIMQKLRT